MKKNNYSTNKKIELTSNEALKQAVTAGLGFSIMPLIGIKNALKNKELQIIPIKDVPIVTHWNPRMVVLIKTISHRFGLSRLFRKRKGPNHSRNL